MTRPTPKQKEVLQKLAAREAGLVIGAPYLHHSTLKAMKENGYITKADKDSYKYRVNLCSGIGKHYGWHGRIAFYELTPEGREIAERAMTK